MCAGVAGKSVPAWVCDVGPAVDKKRINDKASLENSEYNGVVGSCHSPSSPTRQKKETVIIMLVHFFFYRSGKQYNESSQWLTKIKINMSWKIS